MCPVCKEGFYLEAALQRAEQLADSAMRARERAEQCLQWMDLWDKRSAMTRSLSGGMKRRAERAPTGAPRSH